MNQLPHIIDSHCHLDRLNLSTHGESLDAALDAARQNGVSHFLCVSIDLENYPAMLDLVKDYPDVSVSVGVHPNERDCEEPTAEQLLELAKHKKVIAIGETGLDYFRVKKADTDWQRDRFRTHIQAAKSCGKPLIIHNREAGEDTLRILREEGADAVGGVMHCFVEDWETAQKSIDMNFYISFSGIVTFKNATELKEVAKQVSLDRMLIETDSPYLAPMPYRGKPNEPAYVRYVAEHIAELRGISVEEVAEATTRNFFTLFNSARDNTTSNATN